MVNAYARQHVTAAVSTVAWYLKHALSWRGNLDHLNSNDVYIIHELQ
jgi:hypothetical protein